MAENLRRVLLTTAADGRIQVVEKRGFIAPAWPVRMEVTEVPENVSDLEVAKRYEDANFQRAVTAISWRKLCEVV